MSAHLVVVKGPDQGRQFHVEEGTTLLIGRGHNADAQLKDPQVDRVHCEFLESEGRYILRDEDSEKGTFVNGQKVSRQEIKPISDLIQIGGTVMRLLLDGQRLPEEEAAERAQRKPPQPDRLAALVAKTLGHYQLRSILGKGRAGMVFRAHDAKANREVALKVLCPEVEHDEEDIKRFSQAMKTLLPLRHPNLVTLLGAGKSGNLCWMAFELVEGESVAQLLEMAAAGPAASAAATLGDWKSAIRIGVHVGRLLDYIHEHGLIHGHLTPANVLIRTQDKATKVIDLVVTSALEPSLLLAPSSRHLMCLAPEQLPGSHVKPDIRADLYGLGAVLYALLAAQELFRADSALELIEVIRSAEPASLKKAQPALPDALDKIVACLLSKRPGDRYQTPKELLADLERLAKVKHVAT